MSGSLTESVKYTRAAAAITCACLAFSLVGCSSAAAETQTEEPSAVNVVAEPVKRDAMSSYIILSSRLEPNNEVTVIPKVSGTVKKVNVEVGQSVAKGDALFEIDDTDIALSAAQADAALASARANYEMTVGGSMKSQLLQLETAMNSAKENLDTAELGLERTQALFDIGSVSQQALESAQTGYDMALLQYETAREAYELTRDTIQKQTANVAQAGVNQAKVASQLAGRQLEYAVVRAEIDGVIGSCTVSEGMMASPSSASVSIVDLSSMVINVAIPDNMLSRIKQGAEAEITVDGAEPSQFVGTVESIAPSADRMSMLFPVKIRVNNPDGALKSGMYATVRIAAEQKSDAISVPISAVLKSGNEYYVYVVRDGVAVRTVVTRGIANEEMIEITEGLSDGDAVVTKGQDFLEDQTPVVLS